MAYREMTYQEVEKIIENHQEWLNDVFGNTDEQDTAYYDKVDNFNFDKLPKKLANDSRRADFSNVRFTNENVVGKFSKRV